VIANDLGLGGLTIGFSNVVAKALDNDINSALLLCQLWFWTKGGEREISESVEQITHATCLSRKQQERAREVLRKKGWLTERLGVKADRPRLFFSLNARAIAQDLHCPPISTKGEKGGGPFSPKGTHLFAERSKRGGEGPALESHFGPPISPKGTPLRSQESIKIPLRGVFDQRRAAKELFALLVDVSPGRAIPLEVAEDYQRGWRQDQWLTWIQDLRETLTSEEVTRSLHRRGLYQRLPSQWRESITVDTDRESCDDEGSKGDNR
jgi:hypothetical protein